MRVHSRASTTSLSSQSSVSYSRKEFQSPLPCEDESPESHPPQPKRHGVEMRSWSYDNVKTYPIMQLPPKTRIEKRKETRLIDGESVEVEVEVEVVVHEKRKRLFLFEPRSTGRI